MLPNVILFSLYLSISFLVTTSAQTTPSTCEAYSKGTIFFKNGRSKKTYILMDFCNPERFQKGLLTIRETDFKAFEDSMYRDYKLVRRHRANDILDLILDNGREFRYVKYKEIGLNPELGLKYTKRLLEVITDGDIVVFKKRYNSRDVALDSKGSPKEQLEFMNSNFELLVQKSWREDPVNVRDIDLEKFLSDNSRIASKYNRFNFLNQKAVFNKNCDIAYLYSLLQLVSDYNGEPKSGYANTTFFEDEH